VIAGASIDADTNTLTNIENADIKAAAAIALNKLAATTINRALVSDGSGFVSPATTTATEIGYVNGVTSAIQTQLDAMVEKAGDTMTGDLILAGDPDSALKAATKQYVDAVAAGLDVKDSVLVVADSNITLSGEQTIDGVLTSSSRVLVKGQTAPEENGIYVSDAGAWSRATDMDAWDEVPGAFCFVEQGSTYADSGWVCTSNDGGTLGVTAISWSQFFGSGTYTTDGQGIEITGTQFALELDGGTLTKSASGVKVGDGAIGDTQLDGNITRTELATGTAYRILANDASGDISENAALTASRAVVSDANGQLATGSTTSAEIGYVNGVTSSIQTQFNNIRAIRGNVSISSDVTLTDQRLHLVDTSAARSLALPAAAADLYLVVKDVTGSAQTNNITLTTPGAETIDGGATYVMDANYDSVTVVSDGSNYFLI